MTTAPRRGLGVGGAAPRAGQRRVECGGQFGNRGPGRRIGLKAAADGRREPPGRRRREPIGGAVPAGCGYRSCRCRRGARSPSPRGRKPRGNPRGRTALSSGDLVHREAGAPPVRGRRQRPAAGLLGSEAAERAHPRGPGRPRDARLQHLRVTAGHHHVRRLEPPAQQTLTGEAVDRGTQPHPEKRHVGGGRPPPQPVYEVGRRFAGQRLQHDERHRRLERLVRADQVRMGEGPSHRPSHSSWLRSCSWSRRSGRTALITQRQSRSSPRTSETSSRPVRAGCARAS